MTSWILPEKEKPPSLDSSLSDCLLCVNQITWNNFPNLLSASTPLAVSAAPIASIFSPPFFGGCWRFSPFPLTRLWQSRQLPAKDLLFENLSKNFFGQGQRLKCDKNRPAGRKPTGRRFEAFCCFLTWYSSYSWPDFSRGGARLFLSGRSGLDYNDSKTAWRRPPVGRHAFNCWEWQKESSGLDFSKPPPVNIN